MQQLLHCLCHVDPRGELRLSGLVQVSLLYDSSLQTSSPHPLPLHVCVFGVHLNMFFMDVVRCKGLHCSSFIVTEAEKLRYCSLADELALGIPSLYPPAELEVSHCGQHGFWKSEIWSLCLRLKCFNCCVTCPALQFPEAL